MQGFHCTNGPVSTCWHCLDLQHSPASLWSKEAPGRGITAFSSIQPPAAVQITSMCLYQISSAPISPLHLMPCAMVPPAYSPLCGSVWIDVQAIQREQRVVKGMCYHKLTEEPSFSPVQALQHPINFSSRRLLLVLRLNSSDLNFYPLDFVIPLSVTL